MAGEVRDGRARERGEHCGVHADGAAHEPELPASRRDRAVVAAMQPGGAGHGGARRVGRPSSSWASASVAAA